MDNSSARHGNWYALGAYVFWGLFPFYWKYLKDIPAIQVLGHRITWSFISLVIILVLKGQLRSLAISARPRVVLMYSLAAVLIAVNWITYIWAVQHGNVIETSLGYFINPLLSVLLGVIFFRERLRPVQWVPICLAGASLLYLTLSYKVPPWIALSLAFSFAFYGLVKKIAPLGALNGLTLETGLLFMPAVIFLVSQEINGTGAFMHSQPIFDVMLVLAGLVTIFPLLLFAKAVSVVPLTKMGLLQYINPTIQFFLGAVVFKEAFDVHRLISFALVWLALIIYGVESYSHYRRRREAQI